MIWVIINLVDYRRRKAQFCQRLRSSPIIEEDSGWDCFSANLCQVEGGFCRFQSRLNGLENLRLAMETRPSELGWVQGRKVSGELDVMRCN